MATRAFRFVLDGVGKAGLAWLLLLLLPAAAWASPCGLLPGICFTNNGGVLSTTSGAAGLLLNGSSGSTLSTITQIGNTLGPNLGTLAFTTGALSGGSLKLGGTFATGTLTITGTIGTFTGVIFSGAFGPSTWVLNSAATCKSNCLYALSGPVTGTWYTGISVAGETDQLLFKSKGGLYNGGSLSLVNGSTAIVTPEPGTLGLIGTGLLGIGFLVRRKSRGAAGRRLQAIV